jgi:biopolymer transport protein ExbD
MAMQVGGKKGSMSDPNVVPLIDVLLVLIIIFMAITPTTPKGLHAQVPLPAPPNQKQQQQLNNRTIVVQVAQDGSLKINQDSVTWTQLGPKLEAVFKERAPGDRVAFIKGDKDVQFDFVARAIDIMTSSGVEKVGLLTKKVEEGQ